MMQGEKEGIEQLMQDDQKRLVIYIFLPNWFKQNAFKLILAYIFTFLLYMFSIVWNNTASILHYLCFMLKE